MINEFGSLIFKVFELCYFVIHNKCSCLEEFLYVGVFVHVCQYCLRVV
jgi:hypothetical protein